MNYQAENLFVKFPPGLTINILLQNTRNRMESNFLTYLAEDNNRQNFILAILRSNGLLNSRNELFTKQSTDSYFSDDLRKFTNTISDIGSKIDVVREGGSLLY